MKIKPWRFVLAVFGWSVFLLAAAGPARAHGPSGTLSERGYREMQRLAHELDEVASHANDQAQHQQAWIYKNDRSFLRSVSRFADRAEQFHARMDTYQTKPWQVDDELRRLLRDAQDVQARAQRARSADDHTIADWNRSVQILNQMIRVYQNDTARRTWEPWDGYGARYGAAPPQPPDPNVYRREEAPDPARLATLAHELADRMDRIYNYATAASGPFRVDPRQRDTVDAILHFRDQARAFHESLESGQVGSQLAAYANHLAQDAREAGARVRQSDFSPQIQEDWQQAMRLVYQIQAAAGSY